jgi:poly(A) polymerase
MEWKPTHPAYSRLIAALLTEVQPVYVVGGAVRDFLSGQKVSGADLDIVLKERAIPVARRLADRLGWAFYPMDPLRDVARLVFTANEGNSLTCDISRIRGGAIEHDLGARDFTVNAMAIALERDASPVLIDVCGGQKDLTAGILRRVSPLSLSEDSARLLRAVRLIVELNLTIEPVTHAQIERLAETLRLCSPERERDELWKMLASPHPRRAIELLHTFGLLNHVFPEISATQGTQQSWPHHQDVYAHTLDVVSWAGHLRDWLIDCPVPDGVWGQPLLFETLASHRFALRRHFSQGIAVGHSRAEWLVWHALFHDIGKPATASSDLSDIGDGIAGAPRIRFVGHEDISAQLAVQRLEHLRFSRQEIGLCEAVVSNHMRLHHLHSSFTGGSISRRAAFRFFRGIGSQQFGLTPGVDCIVLALADYLGTYGDLNDDWKEYLSHAKQLLDDAFAVVGEPTSQIVPLVDGHGVMRHLDIRPGKLVGEILEQIMEAQAAGEIGTVEEALALAARLQMELGEQRPEDG